MHTNTHIAQASKQVKAKQTGGAGASLPAENGLVLKAFGKKEEGLLSSAASPTLLVAYRKPKAENCSCEFQSLLKCSPIALSTAGRAF